MVGVALRVADVMGGGGGVYPQSSHADRICILLDLRGGAQYPAHRQFQPGRPVFAAIGLLREQDVVAKSRFDFSDRAFAALLSL